MFRVIKPLILLLIFFSIILVTRIVTNSSIFGQSLNEVILSESRVWGTRVELIPPVFSSKMLIDVVETKLRGAGFKLENKKEVWTSYKIKNEPGKYIYSRLIHDDGYCKINAYVFVEFNRNKKLVFAEGTVDEDGCI